MIQGSSLSTIAFYEAHAVEYGRATLHLDLHDLYERFLAELPAGSHILDAGCGSGRDTKTFLAKGFRVTAIDASEEMAKMAAKNTGQDCRVLYFQQMEFHKEFDGIWACSSLLHVPKDELIGDVMPRFINSLRPSGIFYISLKEGMGELRLSHDGRFFGSYTVETFRQIVAAFPALQELAHWKTDEQRSKSNSGPWLSLILRRRRTG